MQTQLQSNTQGKSPPTFLISTFKTTRDSFLQSLKETLVAVAKLFICVSSWTDSLVLQTSLRIAFVSTPYIYIFGAQHPSKGCVCLYSWFYKMSSHKMLLNHYAGK